MAFGQLVGKWRILKNPLQCRIKKFWMVIHTCIRLHNFIINDKMSNNIDIVDEDDNGFEVVPPPERVPKMYSMQPKYSKLGPKRYFP